MLGYFTALEAAAVSGLIVVTLSKGNRLDFQETVLASISVFFLVAFFNVLLLTGRYAIPLIGRAVGVSVRYSTSDLAVLLGVEVILAVSGLLVQWRHTSSRSDVHLRRPYWLMRFHKPARATLRNVAITAGALILVLGPQVMQLASRGMPATSLVWYYHGLTKSIIGAGGFPTQMMEYGGTAPFDATYVGYNVISIFFYSALGLGDINFLMLMTVLVTAISFVFAVAFFETLIPFPYAVGATTAIFSMKLFIFKLATFRTEALAICLMFMGLWLFQKSVEHKDKGLLLLAGLVLGAQVSTNASNATVGIALVLSILLADFFLRRKTLSFRPFVFFLAIGVVAAVAAFGLAVGELPVLSSLSPHFQTLVSDPTWGFLQAIHEASTASPSFPADYMPGYFLGDVLNNLVPIFILATLGILSLLIWGPSRRLTLMTIFFVSLLYLAGSYFFFTSPTYVPARSGFQRIFPYIYIGFGFLPFAILTSLPNVRARLGRGLSVTVPYKQIIAVAIVACVFVGNLSFITSSYQSNVTMEGYDGLVWLRNNTSPSSIFVVNQWASGAALSISQRNCLDDGDAPYLRTSALPGVNSLLQRVTSFYAEPQDNLALLADYNVTYVMVSLQNSLSGPSLVPTSVINEPLMMGLGMRQVYDTGNIQIFQTSTLSPDFQGVNPTIIYSGGVDNWRLIQVGQGNLGATFYTGSTYQGNSSLAFSVRQGSYQKVGIALSISSGLNMTAKDYFSLMMYGSDTGQSISIELLSPNGQNYFYYNVGDTFNGWAQLVIPLTDFSQTGSPTWGNVTSVYLSVNTPGATGTWSVGHLAFENYPTQ